MDDRQVRRDLNEEANMAVNGYSLTTLNQFVGQEIGVSEWVTVDQERIYQFADSTGDHQWIHVDVERAKRESPFQRTIAHGFLSLSLLAGMVMEIGIVPPGVAQALNYGLDRVRFMAPVRAGRRVRGRVVLQSVEEQKGGRILLKTKSTLEIEGEDKPALVAEMLSMLMRG
jgi:acyl dehydratase